MNIWVISGCSSGLGRCWTHSVIADRHDLVIGITRSREAASEMAATYQGSFTPCIADVRDAEQVASELQRAVAEVGVPNRVVTSAGYAQFGTLEDLTNAQLREQFETNVEGTLNVIRPLLPQLRRAVAARILVVSSMSGVSCWPLLGAYQISKHAVEAISDTLREELRDFGIQVGCIEPGPHQTGWATTYARRSEVKAPYNAAELLPKARCGYPIEPPEATLPLFWRMFDAPSMPKRIATSRPFVERAVGEAEERIREWRDSYGQ